MSNSEQIGWNFDYANTSPNAKNIFFFKDTNHTNALIQEKIKQEAVDKINQMFFNKIFIEGYDGDYINKFASKQELEEKCRKEKFTPHSTDLLAYEFPDNKISLFGIEDIKLLELEKKYSYLEYTLSEIAKKRKLNLKEKAKLQKYQKISNYISIKRSFKAAENAIDYMNKHKIKTAGIIFGEFHFKDMRNSFIKENIGVIHYNPGYIEPSSEEVRDYFKRMAINKQHQ